MKSKVHPTDKTAYHVANGSAYNQALVRRGHVTLWLAPKAVAAWTPRRSGRRGGQRPRSDLAIETALTLRLIYHLPLRQAEGLLNSLFAMMHLDLSADNYSTLSRRGQHLPRRLRPVAPGDHIVRCAVGSGGAAFSSSSEAPDCLASTPRRAELTGPGDHQRDSAPIETRLRKHVEWCCTLIMCRWSFP